MPASLLQAFWSIPFPNGLCRTMQCAAVVLRAAGVAPNPVGAQHKNILLNPGGLLKIKMFHLAVPMVTMLSMGERSDTHVPMISKRLAAMPLLL